MSSSIKKEINFEIISKVFSNYNLGTIQEEHKQIKGDVDINYKIVATSGVYLLKHIQNKINIPQFQISGDLHEYLIGQGIPVPKIYKTKNNRFIEDDFILYEFIDGEIKKDWNKAEVVSLVSNFANMLVALKDYPVPDFAKNKNDKYTKGYDIKYCHEVFRPKVLELPVLEEVKSSIIKIIDLLYSKLADFEKLPKFLIHGDLNEMNAIFKDGKNVGIIDFGMSYDPIVYDLGEFIYWFAMPWWTKDFNEERYYLIIEIFEKILPLSKEEKKLLPYMILRRGMMDDMLTLQWYWSNQGIAVPENRLALLTKRNNKIINLFNL